jgi:hypothetical protein
VVALLSGVRGARCETGTIAIIGSSGRVARPSSSRRSACAVSASATSFTVTLNARRTRLTSESGTEKPVLRRCDVIARFHGVRGARVDGSV